MSLDDIWAEPIVETAAGPSTSEGARKALFLSDSEDDLVGNDRHGRLSRLVSSQADVLQGPEKAQLDSMFAGLDDDDDPFGDVAPAVDIASLKRQADAKVAAAAAATDGARAARDKDKEDKGKTTRRVMPKMDAERLLGPDGFPRLLKEYKSFKVTGKGHEHADLEKLFRIYHAWTHKMYPRFQFSDTVERVEKLCRSRRMAVNLKVWRDEAHGMTPGVRHHVSGSQSNDGSDSERDGENEETNTNQSAPGPASPLSSRPDTPVTRPASAASTAPSVPSSTTDIDNDMDVEALLREEEELLREMSGAGKAGSSYKPANACDDDEALWNTAGGVLTDAPDQEGPTSLGEADDDDMWDIFDDMKDQGSEKVSGDSLKAAATATSEPVAPSEPPAATIGADWDDMYE